MFIGLSQTLALIDGRPHDSIDQGWYKVLDGHNLFFLPNADNQDFDKIADSLDSFIITGNTDNPEIKPILLKIISKMVIRNKPILGVGFGAIMLAEFFGCKTEEIKHHMNTDHPIFYHREVLEVNSFHTVGIKEINQPIEILCLDYLGYIEAFKNNNIAGIMWHPESMDKPWIPPEIAFMLKI